MPNISLQELLRAVGLDFSPDFNPRVTGLAYDSRKVKPGDLFFAIPGFKEDGARYVSTAIQAGAVAAIVQNLQSVAPELRNCCFEDHHVREAMAVASTSFYQNPTRNMLCLGVTGTKGKTSTAFVLESILNAAQYPTALTGTVLCRYPGYSQPAVFTTMESVDLQKFLAAARDHGTKAVALEVSSHALSLHRVWGVQFDGVIFTNLSEDHLDFYGSMEAYFQGKRKLFTDYRGSGGKPDPVGVVNIDDPYGQRLLKESAIPVFGFGHKQGDYKMPDVQESPEGIWGTIECPGGDSIKVHSHLAGRYNILNIVGAAALAHQKGIKPATIEQGISNLPGIPGRLERVPTKLPFEVFVDFAHMGSALENVLKTLRPLCKGRLVVLFGAGGDKPPDRRVQLATVAAKIADVAWVTSDNPRTEEPQKIIDAIVSSYQKEQKNNGRKTTMNVEIDRRRAIELALADAREGDIVCLAGRGHQEEYYQGGAISPFDDRAEARRVLRMLEADRNA